MRRPASLSVLALALTFAPHPARAQSTSSALAGQVRTLEGQPAPGAVIEARSDAIGVVRGAIAGVEGRFRIDLLQPGTWIVTARLADGPAGEPRTVTLGLQQTLTIELAIGTGLTESVVVTAGAERLDPDKTGWDLRVSRHQVDDLPIKGRTVADLALLDATVKRTPPGNFFGERGSVFVVNGQSGRANSFLVDGLDNNDAVSSTSLDSFFSAQVIQEFVVLTSQFAPEFGRASGGVLNIITRQGTNDAGGEVFAQGAPRALSSTGEFVGSLPPPEGLQDTSGTFSGGLNYGGPIRRDRAFYFVSYEHNGSDDVVPYTGTTREGVAGGWMVAPNRSDNLFLRTDFNLGDSNFLMLRLSGDDRKTEGLNVAGNFTPEAGFDLRESKAQLAATLTTVVAPNLLNEARLLATDGSFDQSANSSRPGVERPSGQFGGNNLNSQERDENRFQLVDNVSWQVDRHALKFGVDVTRTQTDVSTRFNPNGNFLYDTDVPFEPGDSGDIVIGDPFPGRGVPDVDDDGDGVIDEPGLIGTYPFVFQLIEGTPTADIDDTRYALFAQDSWDVNDRWTLSYGLRYDLSTFTLPEDVRVPSSIPNGGAGMDDNNVAPRFGFTWRPQGGDRLLVRGGAGLFYDKLVLGFPAVAAITSGTEIGLTFPQGLALEITEDVVEEFGIDAVKEVVIFPENLVLRFSTGTELDTPYTVQYSLGMEAALGETQTVRGGVTRALGYHQTLMRDLNPVVATDPLGIPIHRDPTVGSIAAIVSEGRTWYSGLDLGWRRRNGRNWIDVSYTLSKALDLGPDPLKGGIYLPPDSDDISGEKARSDADQRHRLVVAGATLLPWGGVWASGQVQVGSGVAFNVTTGRDENNDGITTDRPPGVGRNTGEDTPLASVNSLRASEGLPPVDSLTEPNFFQVDLRLWKPFTYHGGDNAGAVFLQVFNVFDRFNPGPMEGRAIAANFGEPIGQTGPSRLVEFGLRLGF